MDATRILTRCFLVTSFVALSIHGDSAKGTDSAADEVEVVMWGNARKFAPPSRFTDIEAIDFGAFHCLALRANGTVIAWGENDAGQSAVPENLRDVVAIAAGRTHSMALKRNGTVVAWGDKMTAAIPVEVPVGLSNVTAIAAGSHCLALKSSGEVIAWGENHCEQCMVPKGLTGVIAISAGDTHSLALKKDGTLAWWGCSPLGRTQPPLGLSGIVKIASGTDHCLAVRADGSVVAWGYDGMVEFKGATGRTNVPPNLKGVVAVSAGNAHSLALKADGSVVGWGSDRLHTGLMSRVVGQATVPLGLSNVFAIDAGFDVSAALVRKRKPVKIP